ncbi:MAG: 23S rRNA (uracil(1939)-C(5))-methyltransferase RlmD [Clostridia bacterium]|nr:23S rRNA (uracil(1939)-C(5))-methyltransferase RlmD [Clostridia bacterium]
MKKNEIYTATVCGYGSEGEGIVKLEGYTVFLPFAIPGEKVRFKVLKVQKNLVFAKIEEILTPAKCRVFPKCDVFQKCGGCQLMHVEYGEQLNLKRELIANCFKKIAFLNVNPLETIPSSPELCYRSKLQLPIRQTEKGIEIGFFALNSHRVVEIDNCIIHGEWCKKVISALKKYIFDKNVSAYNEITHKGIVRHIVVKQVGLQFMVILVINGDSIPFVNYFKGLLSEALGEFSLFLNINKRTDNVILTDDFIHICGNSTITDSFLGVKYSVGPASFMQVNESVKAKLYSKAIELVGDSETVIDAYCGAGLLTALFAKRAKKVVGIEIVEEAIDCAKEMAKENGILNADFICSPCEEVLPEIIKQNNNCTLVLDPPRKGLDRKIATAVIETKPKKIVYISCSPQTLARDVGIIGGSLKYEGNNLVKAISEPINCEVGAILPNGYKIDYICGYDMFAQCKGVETLCVLKLVE